MVLTLVALALFMRDEIPLETSSMIVIAALAIGFELFPYAINGKVLHATEFFHGFGHEALVAVCALMIVGHGLVRTGALEPLGGMLARLWSAGPLLAMLLTLTVAAVLSAFVNNAPIVVLLLPVLISVSLRTKSSPSAILMPMGFATLIGGTATTIGTSTNLLVVLALHRAEKEMVSLGSGMGDVKLRAGDVLLVQGPAEQIAALRRDGEFLVLDTTTDLPHVKRSPTAIMIMAGVIVVAAVGILPIAVSAVVGVLLMIATRCLSWREAGGALNTQVILIVVASLGLGLALLQTGGAAYLAQLFVATTFGAPPIVVLGGLTLLMGVLTNVVSSNAAAVIGTPIAVSIAQQIGQPPEAFVLAVIFGSNLCYATPLAHKINVLVMAAGGYTFGDFVRAGVPLAVVMWLAYTLLLGAIYGV